MPSLKYSQRALLQAERLVDFLRETDPGSAAETWALIESAIEILREHPHIGRQVEHGLRELVISRGRSGYLALYVVEERLDRVLVLALRNQRAAGYE